jgi:hypothetical protein
MKKTIIMGLIVGVFATIAMATTDAISPAAVVVDARSSGSDNVAAGSSDDDENAGSGFHTAVCGPDAAHFCQTSDGQ